MRPQLHPCKGARAAGLPGPKLQRGGGGGGVRGGPAWRRGACETQPHLRNFCAGAWRAWRDELSAPEPAGLQAHLGDPRPSQLPLLSTSPHAPAVGQPRKLLALTGEVEAGEGEPCEARGPWRGLGSSGAGEHGGLTRPSRRLWNSRQSLVERDPKLAVRTKDRGPKILPAL